jgi:hypothetical protein
MEPAYQRAARFAPRHLTTFSDVEVVSANGLILMCRVGNRMVAVPSRRILPGSEVSRAGDRGRLVIGRELALNLGLL